MIKSGGYQIHVRSIAGIESCCYVDSIDVAFDMGCIFGNVVSKSNVFITHGHADHIGAFVMHAAQRSLQNMKPARYYVPKHMAPYMEAVLQNFSAMQEDVIQAHIVPVDAHEEIQINSKWSVIPFPTIHRIPSLGYLLYRKVNKLRPDLVGCDGKVIAVLRQRGEQVTRVVYTPEIAYTGDTTIEVFERAVGGGYKDLLQVNVLITEATFLDDKKTCEEATMRGHIHLKQLLALEHLFVDIQNIVLVHCSARYGSHYLEKIVASQLPPSLEHKVVVAGYESIR